MTKHLTIVFLVAFIAGCGSPEQRNAAVTIGDIPYSLEEYMAAYSNYRFTDAQAMGDKEFLDNFINRKLILLEAEKAGLARDPEFLRGVQRYWEQSLLKLILNKKTAELSHSIEVSPEEIQHYYQVHKEKSFNGQALADVSEQIRYILLKQKQNNALEEWVESLRTTVPVKIDYEQLGMTP